MHDLGPEPGSVAAWTCARCHQPQEGRPKAKLRVGGELCCNCVESLIAAQKIERCKAAVAQLDPAATNASRRVLKEVKARSGAAVSTETSSEPSAPVVDEGCEGLADGEIAVYELAPEIEPSNADRARPAELPWSKPVEMKWEPSATEQRGASGKRHIALGVLVLCGLAVLAWQILG